MLALYRAPGGQKMQTSFLRLQTLYKSKVCYPSTMEVIPKSQKKTRQPIQGACNESEEVLKKKDRYALSLLWD